MENLPTYVYHVAWIASALFVFAGVLAYIGRPQLPKPPKPVITQSGNVPLNGNRQPDVNRLRGSLIINVRYFQHD